MSPEIVPVVALVAISAIATVLPINMGAPTFVAARSGPPVGLARPRRAGRVVAAEPVA